MASMLIALWDILKKKAIIHFLHIPLPEKYMQWVETNMPSSEFAEHVLILRVTPDSLVL